MFKSEVYRAFQYVTSISQIKEMGLPIAQRQTLSQQQQQKKKAAENQKKKSSEDQDQSQIIEFDLQSPKKLRKALNLEHLDCYPLLWCYQQKPFHSLSINLKQTVACKNISIFLLQDFPTVAKPDMFNFVFQCYNLTIPPLQVESLAAATTTASAPGTIVRSAGNTGAPTDLGFTNLTHALHLVSELVNECQSGSDEAVANLGDLFGQDDDY